MSVNPYLQKAQFKAVERKKVLAEVNQMAVAIGRCEETIASVMSELNVVNAKYQGTRTTREEVEYLEVLLDCAKRKLAWEKQIASLKKKSPALLEAMSGIMQDSEHPPSDELKTELLRALQLIQSSLERLQGVDAEE